MKNYFKRLTHIDKDQPINFLAAVLLYITFALGMCFTFFPKASGADDSVLYQATTTHVGAGYINIFGIVLLIVTALNITTLLARHPMLGDLAALLGFMSWVFVGTMYGIVGFWYGVFIYAVPNITYWVWYYRRISYLRRLPEIPDPLR